MKLLYLTVLLLVLAYFSSPVYAQAPVTIPYTNTTINYIRTWEPSAPLTDPAVVTGSIKTEQVKESTQYIDGLGRSLQSVNKAISSGGFDQVTPLMYDEFGREQYKYLPYISTGKDGKFKMNPFNEQRVFMSQQYSDQNELFFYSSNVFEASALNRVMKTMPPGNSWTGSNRGVTQEYTMNTNVDAVRIWTLSAATQMPVSTAVYDKNVLRKTVATDEQGNRVVEFKDKSNRTVLKRTELLKGAADGHDGWLCTYYVYDDLNNLRCVIPPKAVTLIKQNWILNKEVVNGLCFLYVYDGRHRVISKKMPGAEATEMVYDVLDRLVFTQDGNLRAEEKWLTTFYDSFNRQIMTAIYLKPGSTREGLQLKMNTAANTLGRIDFDIPAVKDLVINFHDNRSKYVAQNSITYEAGFDSGNSEFEAFIDANGKQGTTSTPTVAIFPDINISELTPLTYTYYDEYNFTGKQPFQQRYMAMLQNGTGASKDYAEVINNPSVLTKGLVTGTSIRILGTDQWLNNTNYYDDRGRVLQVAGDNANGGRDVVSNRYDFNGKVLSTYLFHHNPRSVTTPQTTILTIMNYDAGGRLLEVIKQLNDDGVNKTISKSQYDEQGQLASKTQGSIHTEKFDYNVRGWILGMNRDHLKSGDAGYFGYELAYDKTSGILPAISYNNLQYNGNVAGTIWKGTGDNRKYDFFYDNANRLMKADYLNNTNGTWTNNTVDFSVKMGDGIDPTSAYDDNGNILGMMQNGLMTNTSGPLDALKYRYLDNSNQLKYVRDEVRNENSTLGDFKEPAANELANRTQDMADYAYDKNGNASGDKNKGISNIRYNYLNLPDKITVDGKGTIEYTYTATGIKLAKKTTDNTVSGTTDYIGGFVYTQDTLRYFTHEEGRVRLRDKQGIAPAYIYDYFVKDYLNNTRIVLTEQRDFSMYMATMEQANTVKENTLFSNIDITRAAKPLGYPSSQRVYSNEFVSKLNAKPGSNKIGPSLVLRVMAGDTIQIGAQAFYKSQQPVNDNSNSTATQMLVDLVNTFSTGGQQVMVHAGVAGSTAISPISGLTSTDYQRLKATDPSQAQTQTGRPRAYLSYLLFDDQFKLVDENSGVRQVNATPDQLQQLGTEKMSIRKNGFLYVYTSNESQQDVFFDDVTLGINTGPVLEETHYYPFGLTMAGISASALKGMGYPENKMKYNGKELQQKEFSDGSGLEWYDYGARMYDQQLGRWMVIDGKAEKYNSSSPYGYVLNNPIVAIDPDGRDLIFVIVPAGKDKKGHLLTKKIMVDQHIAKQAYNFAWAMYNKYGVTVNEHYRTRARQQELYDNRANNSNPVAKPGSSNHEGGFALDFTGLGVSKKGGLSKEELTKIEEYKNFAKEYGYDYLAAKDPPHFMINPLDYYAKKHDDIKTNSEYYINTPAEDVPVYKPGETGSGSGDVKDSFIYQLLFNKWDAKMSSRWESLQLQWEMEYRKNELKKLEDEKKKRRWDDIFF